MEPQIHLRPARAWRMAMLLLSVSLAGGPRPPVLATPGWPGDAADSGGLAGRGTAASSADRAGRVAAYGQLPLSFEANQGQADASVDFVAHGQGYTLALTGGEAVLDLRQPPVPASADADPAVRKPSSVVRVRLVGASAHPSAVGQQELAGTANYFLGNDPTQWHTGIRSFARAHYQDVYYGIDLVYHADHGQLEYDFVVSPDTDPGVIRLTFAGADQPQLDDTGGLVVHVPGGQLREPAPTIYQEGSTGRMEVAGGYVVDDLGQVGFAVSAYDPTRPLIIDPVLVYSTFLGGSGVFLGDLGAGIAMDTAGNAYVTGITESADFPTTPGSMQQTFGGGSTDAFVAKLNPTGTALVYSAFLGGSAREGGDRIAVDAAGNAYVTGFTESSNFPTTVGAFQTTLAGNRNAFVSKLNPTGTALVYSTYLGGSGGGPFGGEVGVGIALDAAGNAYVTGSTGSANFPTTPGALQQTFGGGLQRAFVAKLNPSGTALVYSSFLGGSVLEQASGIALDAAANAYVTGGTSSPDFPTTVGAFRRTFGANGNAYVAKLNPTGTALVYSTYLGGSGFDVANAIAVDGAGKASVTGFTTSGDFPTTPGAVQPTLRSGQSAFVTKLNSSGTALVYSTFLGGHGPFGDRAASIAQDGAGNAYVIGDTTSADFPTTPDAVQPTIRSGQNGFVTKLNPTGTALIFSTFLGGSNFDRGHGIAVDGGGNAYITGDTGSADFPTTAGAFQQTLRGRPNAFVAKIAFQLVVCTTTISGSRGRLVVEPGGTTCLERAHVAGAVLVRPGARLFIDHSTIGGAIVAKAPAFFGMCDSTAKGAVSVTHATGFALIGDPTDDACGGNTVTGAVVLKDNQHAVEVAANHIGGSLVATGTSGTGPFAEDTGAEIENNVIDGALVCKGNAPAPTNDGQPNTVTGAKVGQCAGL